MLKRLLFALLAIGLIFLTAIFALPSLVPTDSYRDRLEGELSRVFARDVALSGDINVSTFPVLKVETGRIELSNPEGFSQSRFVDLESMSANVRLWPLLKKRVEISAITLQSPDIRLEKLTDGRTNWTAQSVKTAKDQGPFKRDGRFTEYDPALDLLRIKNGKISYIDQASDQGFIADNINLDLRAPGLDQALKLNGDLIFDGLATSIDAQIDSPMKFLSGLQANFSADIKSAEGGIDLSGQFLDSTDITLTANFKVDSNEPNTLATRFPLPNTFVLPQLTSVSAKGDLSYSPDAITIPKIDANIVGSGIEAIFNGNLVLDESQNGAGQFTLKLDDLNILSSYLKEPVPALNAVTSFDGTGMVEWSGQNFRLSDIDTNVGGPELSANFKGDAAYDSKFSLTGEFEGRSDNFAALMESAGVTQADAAALKKTSARGTISLTDGAAKVSNLVAEASEGFVNGQYEGTLKYDDQLALDGRFESEINDLKALDQALPREIPYTDVVKHIVISSSIQSRPDGYVFSDLSSELKDGLLNGNFKGRLALGDNSTISGNLSITANSLRAIAASQEITLPPSTEIGEILEAFSLSGQVSGTPERLAFSSGNLSLDNLIGRGDFDLDLAAPKPLLTGSLSLNALDLRPYMAAWSDQNPEGEIRPWSAETIKLNGLEALEAKIDIITPSVIMDRLELGATTGSATLKSGIMSADLKKTQLYDGDASGRFVISAINGVPTLSVDAVINSVAAQSFFMSMGGFEKITGTSDLILSFKGQGQSQADIMKSLTGSGNYRILQGQLLGLDASALLSGVDTALSERRLPDGLGLGRTTDFNDLNGEFSLNNGRASLSGFRLSSGTFYVEADGFIDIGQQTIDIGLRPKLTTGSDLAQFGIPLRFKGGFGAASPGLDTDFLGDISKAKARQKAGNVVRDNIGGTIGNILGGVISGEEPNSGSSQDTAPNPEDSDTEPVTPATGNTPPTSEADSQPTTAEPSTPEEQIGNALKDLFGRKNKE